MDLTPLQKGLTPICPYCDKPIEEAPINDLYPECNDQLNSELTDWEKEKAA